jgi:hypothetical protein
MGVGRAAVRPDESQVVVVWRFVFVHDGWACLVSRGGPVRAQITIGDPFVQFMGRASIMGLLGGTVQQREVSSLRLIIIDR